MKVIKIFILLVSFLGIAVAAFFQLIVLLLNNLFFQHNYYRHFPRQG